MNRVCTIGLVVVQFGCVRHAMRANGESNTRGSPRIGDLTMQASVMTLSPDTDAKIEQWQIQRLREMPASRKLALMDEMSHTVRTLALAGLRQRHPDDSPARPAAVWPTSFWGRSWRPGCMVRWMETTDAD